jgi:hypothetical protein
MGDPPVPHRAAALAALLERTATRGQVRWDHSTATYVPVDRPTDDADAQADAVTVALLLTELLRRWGRTAHSGAS